MPASDRTSAAAAAEVGPGTLERLARLDAQGHPILSIYVDLDPQRFPTSDTRGTELGALLDSARRQGGSLDADRVEAWLNANPGFGRGAHGVAVFSAAPAGIFEVVPLPAAVEPMAIVDTVPWLEPLAAIISPGDWGVAVVSRRTARLLRGGPGDLSEFATVTGELYRRHSQGGWSQARFQRGIEEQVAAHVRVVADHLLRAHLRKPFRKLVIVCSDELRPVIDDSLARELTDVRAGTVDADLEHAPTGEIAAAIAPIIERVERERELDLIAQLEQALGTGGPAAAGLDEVLSTLEQQRVQILLVGEHPPLMAGLCPTCGRLSTDGGQTCPLDGGRLAEVDATAHAVEEAARQSAQVMVAHYDTAWLHQHGDIAALLRW